MRFNILIMLIMISLCSIYPALAKTTTHATTPKIKHHNPTVHAKHKNKKHTHLSIHHERVNANLAAIVPASTSILHASDSVVPLNHTLASINVNTINNTIPSESFITSVEKNLINFVHKTVSTLHYSSYKLGGTHFDTEHGVYIVDCSSFVDHILQEVYPNAYSNLVNSAGTDNPASSHYYHFFHALPENSDQYWNKIADVEELRPGDILVFRYKNSRGAQTGGHVMVVMDKPVRVSDVFFVRIADSASSGHSEDTRQPHTSGIGIGTLLLKANPKTGRPSAYAWGVRSYWNHNVTFAMARPSAIDMPINNA
ncbi:MAG: hypothetical protein ACD_45C00718G0003 [uncultured bacterium]|nr:MAG: hypothetical protein ACD_45C00718G0003 [uncultured bacterium]